MIDSWGGQPKGLKQLLLERGLIDLQSLGLYTKNGPKLRQEKALNMLGDMLNVSIATYIIRIRIP